MADDRMKNDDLNRNMGGNKAEGQEYSQQTPGRNPQGGGTGQAGQRGAGQQGAQQGASKAPRNTEDDDDEFGAGQSGSMNRGGQNR